MELSGNRRPSGLGSPDCPVYTGQCPVHHRTVSGAPEDSNSNSPPSGISRGTRAIIHRTVRCTPDCPVRQGRTASGTRQPRVFTSAVPLKFTGLSGVHRTVRCASGATVICAQRSTLQRLQMNSECQSRSQRGTGLSGAAPDCPVPHEDKASNGRLAPISTDRMTWLAHRTCPVCTGLSGAPIASSFANGYNIGWWL
jgi:hypothetical protein